MSLLPMFLREFSRPMRMIEQQMREELFRPTFGYFVNQPRFQVEYPETENEATIEDNDKIQIKFNMQGFKPEHIKVKTINGNTLEVEAKFEENYDDGKKGFISKHVLRRFVFPKGHDIQKSYSSFSSDGILTITTPKSQQEEQAIPIEHEQANTESEVKNENK
ncbi:alpha-crystallin B chain-like [Diabrotica virgifera virgifera]|uniref:Alpha-crystallin B chain-like n=1 Tax=Diabrotica virgifera virgifera TaxID=50390 RepID=A0A6P7GHG9_DIAVI|nr:alpha-crystallin B chain-like [Diabrotica virgifera virgifera]